MHFYFKPTRTFTLLFLLLFPIFISLGFWQLHRAEEKRLLQEKFELQGKIPPITLQQAKKLTDARYYPIQLTGYFDDAHSILLDNQFYRHRIGYQVITPFKDTTTQQWILINRGWVPMDIRRDSSPKIPIIEGKKIIKGILYIPQNNPFVSKEIEINQLFLRIQSIDISSISKYLGYPLQPYIVLLDPTSPYGFIRSWQPVNMKASMHVGYAVQWFSMAALLLVIYIGVNVRSSK